MGYTSHIESAFVLPNGGSSYSSLRVDLVMQYNSFSLLDSFIKFIGILLQNSIGIVLIFGIFDFLSHLEYDLSNYVKIVIFLKSLFNIYIPNNKREMIGQNCLISLFPLILLKNIGVSIEFRDFTLYKHIC